MPLTAVAVVVALTVLTALSALQVLVAAGRPYGHLVWGGRHRVLPRPLRVASAVSVGLYAAMAAVLVWRAGGAPRAVEVAAWVLVGYFALGIVANGASRSRPERAVMTPACAVLALCALQVALRGT